MNHPLFVGHLDVAVRSFRPTVIKPLDVGEVLSIFAKHCDHAPDGTLVIANLHGGTSHLADGWLGRIEREDVLLEDGYLICPWLSANVNHTSVRFIGELYESLGIKIYEPGDAVFFQFDNLKRESSRFHD